MAVQIQMRRGTVAQWSAANPTLAEGEIGLELDTQKFKMGTGTTAWNSLGYYTAGTSSVSSVNGQTGIVVLGTDNVTEGTTNKYYTDARARAAVSATGSLSYNSTTGVFSYTQPTNVSTFTNDSGYLTSSAIGTTVQGYNASTVVDASYVHTDNNYTTTEKSKLAGIAAGAEVNVNADWNAVSGDAQILNKPSLATVATSGSYSDLSGTPSIPSAITIKDEGTTLTSAPTSIDFVGANVTATNVSGAVTVTISGGGGGSGTVTSVGMTVPTGLTVTGSPITTSGTLAISYATGYSIPTNTSQTNWNTAYGWGNHASAGYAVASNNLSDLTNASTARTNLGLGTMATANTSSYTVTGSDTTYAYRANNLSDLASASTARTNLGLGTAATMTGPSGTIVGTTDTQTLSGKTLTGTKETVFAITDAAAFEINPANGGIQTITLGANRTPKGTNFVAGQSVTLMITAGAFSITWTDTTFGTSGVKWVGASAPGSAPTLSSSAVSIVELWEVGTQVYGAFVGVA
jgi:hypothetical protein